MEAICLRIRLQQGDVVQPALRDPLACAGQHRPRDVDAEDLAAVAHCLGERYRRGARAAADFKYLFSTHNRRARQQQIVDLPDPGFYQPGEADPARAGNRVPVLALGGICFVVHLRPLPSSAAPGRCRSPLA